MWWILTAPAAFLNRYAIDVLEISQLACKQVPKAIIPIIMQMFQPSSQFLNSFYSKALPDGTVAHSGIYLTLLERWKRL